MKSIWKYMERINEKLNQNFNNILIKFIAGYIDLLFGCIDIIFERFVKYLNVLLYIYLFNISFSTNIREIKLQFSIFEHEFQLFDNKLSDPVELDNI